MVSMFFNSVVLKPLNYQEAKAPLLPLPEKRLMHKILHDPKDPKLWELWYIPYNG